MNPAYPFFRPIYILLFASLILFYACEKDDNNNSNQQTEEQQDQYDQEQPAILRDLSTFPADTFYTEEIIPAEYLEIYGKWKMERIGGGFGPWNPDWDFPYDYLVLKPIGIYGRIRNDTLIESGKIAIADLGNLNSPDRLELEFGSPNIYDTTRVENVYIELTDSSMIISYPCYDCRIYHFKRVEEK